MLDKSIELATNYYEKYLNLFLQQKKDGKGTGLGLSISYLIICKNHQGNIIIESQLGKGTRFIIDLPTNLS